jgi:hypothetical protein
MGRLSIETEILTNCPTPIIPIPTGLTNPLYIEEPIYVSDSGKTKIDDVHIFIDESGNVTQIKKEEKSRLKYCVDPNVPQTEILHNCLIGVSDPDWGDCTNGIALGVGDVLTTFANYVNE